MAASICLVLTGCAAAPEEGEQGCPEIACGPPLVIRLSSELTEPGTYDVVLVADSAEITCTVVVPSWTRDTDGCHPLFPSAGAGGRGMPAGIAGSAGTVAGVAAAGGASAQPEDTVGTCHALSRGLSAVVYSCGGFASLRLDATPERVDLTVSKDGSGIISESYELEYVQQGTDGDCLPCSHAEVTAQVM